MRSSSLSISHQLAAMESMFISSGGLTRCSVTLALFTTRKWRTLETVVFVVLAVFVLSTGPEGYNKPFPSSYIRLLLWGSSSPAGLLTSWFVLAIIYSSCGAERESQQSQVPQLSRNLTLFRHSRATRPSSPFNLLVQCRTSCLSSGLMTSS